MIKDHLDLVDSDDISEIAILNELKRRFSKDVIYSSIGPIIIALNPYKNIADLYTPASMALYLTNDHSNSLTQSPPHVWTIAQSAYNSLDYMRKRQAIIISGESGGSYCCHIVHGSGVC